MSNILEKIRTRGYWDVTIHPTAFVEKRFESIADLQPALDKEIVSLRGWDYPHIDHRTPITRGLDWIEQRSEWQQYLEVWRFYQSGQFRHVFGLPWDWRDQSEVWPPESDWVPGRSLPASDVLLQYTEILLFAARMADSQPGEEPMHVAISLKGLANRQLQVDTSHFPVWHEHTAAIAEFPYVVDLPRPELIARNDEIAVDAARELFLRFGWEPSRQVLRDWQQQLRRGRH